MTKRDRLMLLVVLAVAMLGGFWMLILNPQRKAAVDAQAKVETARTQLTAAQQQLSSARQAEDAYRRDRTTVVKLGRVVPETDDIPTLLTQLSALARKEKVQFNAYSLSSGGASSGSAASTDSTDSAAGATEAPSKSSTAAVAPLFPPGSVEISGGLGRTPIALELTGQYFELERYLRAVQRFAVLSQKRSTSGGRLMVVDGFSYIFDEAEGNQNRRKPELKATLSASVYFAPPLEVPDSAGAGADASAAPAPSSTGSATGPATIGGLR